MILFERFIVLRHFLCCRLRFSHFIQEKAKNRCLWGSSHEENPENEGMDRLHCQSESPVLALEHEHWYSYSGFGHGLHGLYDNNVLTSNVPDPNYRTSFTRSRYPRIAHIHTYLAGIIALIMLMVVHEFGHGILARAQGVRIKSIGVILLAILPGAFVELDEEDVKKAKRAVKLRIYAAGSMFNLGLAGIAWVIVIVLTTSFIPYAFEPDGLKITSVTPGGPSEGVLKEGMVIHGINGQQVSNRTAANAFLNNTKPGDELTLLTDQGTYTITSAGNPNNASATYIGIRGDSNPVVEPEVAQTYGDIIPWFLYNLADLCFWIYALNLMVGLFNLLPMKPLDGGVIFEELLGYKIPENITRKIVTSVSWVMIAIVALLIIYGLVPGIIQMF